MVIFKHIYGNPKCRCYLFIFEVIFRDVNTIFFNRKVDTTILNQKMNKMVYFFCRTIKTDAATARFRYFLQFFLHISGRTMYKSLELYSINVQILSCSLHVWLILSMGGQRGGEIKGEGEERGKGRRRRGRRRRGRREG